MDENESLPKLQIMLKVCYIISKILSLNRLVENHL